MALPRRQAAGGTLSTASTKKKRENDSSSITLVASAIVAEEIPKTSPRKNRSKSKKPASETTQAPNDRTPTSHPFEMIDFMVKEGVETVTSPVRKVNSALAGLGVLEFEVITALFPESGRPASYQEIAERFGLDIKEVRDIEANALRDLRGTRKGLKHYGAPWN